MGPFRVEDGRLRDQAVGFEQGPRLHDFEAALGLLERVDCRKQGALGRDRLLHLRCRDAQMLAEQPVPETGDCRLNRGLPARLNGEVTLGIDSQGTG